MPIIEECSFLVMKLISSETSEDQLAVLRKVKHAAIGSKKNKFTLVQCGLIPRLLQVLEDERLPVSLLCEAAMTLGSLAYGTPETVKLLVKTNAVQLLTRGLCHVDSNLSGCCARALRVLYQSGMGPAEMIFENNSVVRRLTQLLGSSPVLSECAGVILAASCQCEDHQNFLFGMGVVHSLHPLLLSTQPKVVLSALRCLYSVISRNRFTSSACANVSMDGNTVSSTVTQLLTKSPDDNIRLLSAQCLVSMYKVEAIGNKGDTNLRIMSTLVHLCQNETHSEIRAQAALILAELVADDIELQIVAANFDKLVLVLITYFHNKPNEEDDPHELDTYNKLCQSAWILLANLGATNEDIRFKIVTNSQIMPILSDALKSSTTEVQIAAARCLLSLSRSAKLLRTYLSDAEVWNPVMKMLCSSHEPSLIISTSVTCNLLLSVSPLRTILIEEGVVSRLCLLTHHSDLTIRLNSLWALMNCCRRASPELLSQVRSSIGMERLFAFILECPNEQVQLKCLGILVNLTETVQGADTLMEECGVGVLETLTATLLALQFPHTCEQALCVLINLSNGCVRTRDKISENTTCIERLAKHLHKENDAGVAMAACMVVKHLADASVAGHVHRQNCLKEAGIYHALQKLEITENSMLQEIVRQALEQFSLPSY